MTTHRIILVACSGFLAATAIPGGAMLLLGLYTPPLEMLRGSLFKSFIVPGLALAVIVGGSALLALVALLKQRGWRFEGAAIAGLVVMSFEFVQVISIGSPAGPSRVMQVGYFVLGILLVGTSVHGMRAESREIRR